MEIHKNTKKNTATAVRVYWRSSDVFCMFVGQEKLDVGYMNWLDVGVSEWWTAASRRSFLLYCPRGDVGMGRSG